MRQFAYKSISCDPLYVSINPLWIQKKFPLVAKSLIASGIVILKYVNEHTREYIIKNTTLPQYVEVFANSEQAISSAIMGKVPEQYILGLYCRIV